MKVTVKEVYDLKDGLDVLGDKELPISTSFKIQQNIQAVREQMKSAEALRSKIIERYKEKDLGNGKIKLKDDKLKAFNKELDELLAQEIDVELKKLTLSELASISVKPKTLVLLNKILMEDEA